MRKLVEYNRVVYRFENFEEIVSYRLPRYIIGFYIERKELNTEIFQVHVDRTCIVKPSIKPTEDYFFNSNTLL